MIFKDKKQNKNDGRNRADGDNLAIQIGFRAFLNGSSDFTHSFISGRCATHDRDEEKSKDEADGGADHR